MASRSKAISCASCKDGVGPPFPFTMAFQPIVNVESETVFAYEALVRGMEGQGAGWVSGAGHVGESVSVRPELPGDGH